MLNASKIVGHVELNHLQDFARLYLTVRFRALGVLIWYLKSEPTRLWRTQMRTDGFLTAFGLVAGVGNAQPRPSGYGPDEILLLYPAAGLAGIAPATSSFVERHSICWVTDPNYNLIQYLEQRITWTTETFFFYVFFLYDNLNILLHIF